ncbi:Anaphase-promoting complex subunit 23 [Mortierella claussenii]|nr:Anaphase-promoting complex subunit 23 [Mortierella claussenii]
MQTSHTSHPTPDRALDPAEVRVELREAVQACNERGLYFAARWAAEALNGLPPIESGATTDKGLAPHSSTADLTSMNRYTTRHSKELSLHSSLATTNAELAEFDAYLMAKAYFDLKELDRCAAVLEGCTSHKSQFLRLYSKYLEPLCSNRALTGPLDNGLAINRELEKIETELAGCYEAESLDAFCKYLYGVVLIKRKRKGLAMKVLIESVNQYPYNWSAWLDLGSCLPSSVAVSKVQPELPSGIMTTYFLSHVTLEHFNNQHDDGAVWLEELSDAFPRSAYVKCERAIALYHARDFPEAAKAFEELIKENPHRLDSLDVFSNVLFVTNNRERLSFLAHSCAMTDNYRPETCCIIGNYYSIKAEHEKAVVYFKRALRLNRSYASAWTLLGHEYLEMKNTYAAVESYRRAVDYNHRDYRAWNGLGQTYEALKMHYYALNYYQRATAIRPYDGRMWCAMAECYEYLDQELAAIKCYTRALLGTDQQKMALKKLPKLYKKIGDTEAAAHYFRKSLEQLREEQSESEDTSEACIFLALYERERGNLAAASDYATEVMQCLSEQHQEDAKALLRDIRSVLDAGESPEID